jgi:pimeloyl-ACP methyl ester carboxylesterase
MRRPATTTAALFGVALGLLAVAPACIKPRDAIFPAPPPRAVEVPAGAELLELPSRDGRTAYALYLPGPVSAPVVVYFHGNGEQLADEVPLAEALRRRDVGVLVVEYPGYGPAASARPGEQAIYEDTEAALAHLRDVRGVGPERVVVMGRSLGTGVAAEMAKRGHAARMVLLSAYTSIPAVARHLVSSSLPAERLITDRFATAEKAPGITVPTLLVHGADDTMIPPTMSERLAELLPKATLWTLDGVGHNDIYARGGDALLDRVAGFARDAGDLR